jgi:hypothetical protein
LLLSTLPPQGHAHGGLIATLLDEVLAIPFVLANKRGLTASLTVQYKSALPLESIVAAVSYIERIEGYVLGASGPILHSKKKTKKNKKKQPVCIDANADSFPSSPTPRRKVFLKARLMLPDSGEESSWKVCNEATALFIHVDDLHGHLEKKGKARL